MSTNEKSEIIWFLLNPGLAESSAQSFGVRSERHPDE